MNRMWELTRRSMHLAVLLALAVCLLGLVTGSAQAVTFDRAGARDWANTHWYYSYLYANASVRNQCTILGSLAWHVGGNIPMDTSGGTYNIFYTTPTNYGAGVTLTDWSGSWTGVWNFHKYFDDYTPSGLTYSQACGWRCSSAPLRDDRLDGGQVLYYHHANGAGNNSFDYYHLAVVSRTDGISFFTQVPGSTKHDLHRQENLVNLSDRYSSDDRHSLFVQEYKLTN